jgi:hypothetical protein
MNSFHYNLNIPEIFLPYKFVDNNQFQEIILNREFINPEFHNWLETFDLKILPWGTRFFSSPPNMKYNLHVDYKDGPVTKINIIFNSTDTVMNWYKLLPGKSSTVYRNQLNQPINGYNIDDCQKVYTAQINNHCLINGNEIHDLINGPNNGKNRHCYSIVLGYKKTNERLPWNRSIEIFRDYLIL